MSERRNDERKDDILRDQREANEKLVLAGLRAREEADDAVGGRRRAEEEVGALRAIAAQEEAVRALFELMPQLGWAANPDGRIYYRNRRWYEYTGMTESQMEGWEAVCDPAFLPAVKDIWNASLASGEPFEASFPLRRHDDVFRWFITRAAPMRNDRGDIIRWVGSNTDIDDLRRAEQALATLAIENAEAFRQTEEARVEEERQRLLRTELFMTAPAAIGLLRGPELVIEFANPAILEVWGRTSAVIGMPLLDALPEVRGQVFEELLKDVMRTGEPFVGNEMPCTLFRAGKLETVYFNFGYAATRDARGGVDGISVFAFDVTAQVFARGRATLGAVVGRSLVADASLTDQLRLCCEGLATLGDESAIWVYNGMHEVLELRACASIEARNGMPHAPMPIGSRKIGLHAQCRTPYLTNAAIGDPHVFEQDWAKGEGMTAFAGHPLIVDGRLVGVVEVFAKQTLSEEVLATLSSVADPIALGIERDNSERFRELFIGMLGHDLRNPLNAVSMAAHVLLSSPALGAHERRTMERVQRSARRMTRMIAQILDFTRARSGGGIPLMRAPGNFHEICAQVTEELKGGQPDRVIETEYLGNADGAWDADRLAQVLSNLVGNALAHGAPDAPVQIVVDATGTDVRCFVRNSGVPIGPELLLTLFDPFRRSDNAKTARTQGLGLGLFISHQIVLAHGGTISVRSAVVEGTEFAVTLPRGVTPA